MIKYIKMFASFIIEMFGFSNNKIEEKCEKSISENVKPTAESILSNWDGCNCLDVKNLNYIFSDISNNMGVFIITHKPTGLMYMGHTHQLNKTISFYIGMLTQKHNGRVSGGLGKLSKLIEFDISKENFDVNNILAVRYADFEINNQDYQNDSYIDVIESRNNVLEFHCDDDVFLNIHRVVKHDVVNTLIEEYIGIKTNPNTKPGYQFNIDDINKLDPCTVINNGGIPMSQINVVGSTTSIDKMMYDKDIHTDNMNIH